MHTIARRLMLAALLPALLLPHSLRADPPPGKGKGKGHKHQDDEGGSGGTVALSGALTFSGIEVQRIRAYYAAQPQGKVKPLPPGIAKNLARGKPLPPGIAKRYAPQGLVRELSVRTGYEILVAGASILLVEAASRVIRDIVENALGG